MTNSFTARGTAGEVRWGYHRAASLGPWTMTRGPEGSYSLTAKVLSSDAFKVSQQPLTFVVPRPKGVTWRFPVFMLQIAADEVSATLGPLLE